MPDKIELSTFPSSRTQALTMLYLEKQDLSNLSPSQLVDKYKEVESKIKARFKETNDRSFSF